MASFLPSNSIKDITEISPIWQLLDLKQQKIINLNLKISKIKKNEIIYEEGEHPAFLLSSIKGKIKIYTKGINNRNQIARIIRPHEFFGYRAIFAEETYVTTAIAFEDCVIYSIPADIIIPIIKSNAALSFEFVRCLSIDLGISDIRAFALTQKNIQGRLAETLLQLHKYYGTKTDNKTISIQLSREDLANIANMTTANAIRTLSILAKKELILVTGRDIKVLNLEGLVKLSRS